MTSIFLVYAVGHPDLCEPLIAVTDNVDLAKSLEHRLSPIPVRWEQHVADLSHDDEIFAVFLAAGGGDGAELLDPIGDGVFGSRHEAERARDARTLSGDGHFVVWSYPVGWTRAGWPFEPEGG